jgi:hypothetical protein
MFQCFNTPPPQTVWASRRRAAAEAQKESSVVEIIEAQ